MKSTRPAVFLACLLAVVVCLAAVWATPSPRGDIFLSLAGGRDVFEGKLGQPDDWAHTTGGAVWVNQSWGSDALFYLIHRMAGDNGLLVARAVLLTGIVLLSAAAARRRGAFFGTGLLVAGVALLAGPSGMGLSPGLLTLLFTPLLLLFLYRSRSNPRWLWGGAFLIGLWANLHEGFLVGLGILALWVLSHLFAAVREKTPTPVLPMAGALVLAFGLAVFANPFGFENLTVSLAVPQSEAWRNVTDWQPVFGKGPAVFTTPWVFFGLMAFLILPALVRGVVSGLKRVSPFRSEHRGRFLFEILLVVIAVGLSFQARTLIPLTAILLTPLVAVELEWLLRPTRRTLPILVMAAGIVVGVTLEHKELLEFYDPENPTRPAEAFHERNIAYGTDFSGGAAAFLESNDITGNSFHEWNWEGFLQWKVPDLKLFVGDRAYQVYDEETYWKQWDILGKGNPRELLRDMDVHLAVVPLGLKFAGFFQRLLVGPDATWAYVYCDQRTAVLADAAHPATQPLVAMASAGVLEYPDPATLALSRAMCLSSPASEGDPQTAVTALESAIQLRPTSFAYYLLVDLATKGNVEKGELIAFLEAEDRRVADMDTAVADGIQILKAREAIARLLERNYDPRRHAEELKKVREVLTGLSEQIRGMTTPD